MDWRWTSTVVIAAISCACGGRAASETLDGGPPADGSAGSTEDAGITCTPPTPWGGSSGGFAPDGGGYDITVNYVETCSDGKTYNTSTLCPYGECQCGTPTRKAIPYDCDSGVVGAFVACGYPH